MCLCVSRCSLHMSDLCVCMRMWFQSLTLEIEGSQFMPRCSFCVLFYVLCVLEIVCMRIV